MYLFESERFRFRELSGDDAQFGYDLNSDPEVIQYTGDPPFASVEEAREFMTAYTETYRRYRCGRWGMELKSTGELVGWCGLKFHPNEQVHDVGYRLFKKYWGKGYASEAAQRTIAYGFDDMRLNRIVAHARKENTASIRVLEKCGLKIIGEGKECGGEIFVFEKLNDAP
jgi:[ribosomal protein S5]-alanine N-acetyltransferase